MAKEKQLFDDKAITFQRAVFIVCNLKRLIKRPKKENDKHSTASASHSRKRSGAENSTTGDLTTSGDHQSANLLEGVAAGLVGDGHAPQYKLRFRDPIRRAFTLPTIICGSFANLGGGRAQHRHDSQCSPDCQLMEADHQQEPSEDEQQQQQQNSETNNAGRLRFWLDQTEPEVAQQPITGTTKQRFVIHSPESPRAATPHSEGSPSSAQSRRASPVSFAGFEQCGGSSTSGRRSRSGSRPGASELITQRLPSRPLNHNLSCLVTPIRRAPNSQLPVAPPPPPPPSRPSVVTSGRQTARRSADDCHGDKVATSTSARQSWCPIWALAMELLDKSQAQPRDSNAHAHLLGPPATTNFLLAPLEPAEQCSSSGLDPSPASYLFDSEAAASMAITKSRADSLDENDDQDNDDDDDGDDDDDDDDDEQNDAQRRQSKANDQDDERRARMRMKRFSSSALCLNNNNNNHARTTINAPPGGGQKTCSAARKKQLALETGSDAKTLGSRLKSKLNNNNNTDALERLATPDAAPNRRDKRSPSSVSSTSAGSKSPGGGLLCAPEAADPIVQLARQRRPSVSNQGSVNVDQQALFSAVECNQLERAKAILEDGKVNVNSLNGDKLTCLDVAVLLRNVEMAKLLQRYQAKESSAYLSREGRENQLYALYMEARRLVEDLSRSIESISAAEQQQPMSNSSSFSGTGSAEQQQQLMLATGSLLSSALFEEKQRQLAYWRRRLELFMQMRYGYQQLEVPNAPELVVLQVVGDTSLGVKIVHSLQLVTELLPLLSDTQTGSAQLPATDSTHSPLADLLQLASAHNLTCGQGAKCSHWLMDEFRALRRSDQLLKNPIQQPEVASNQHLSRCRARTNEQHKHQERLAVFNYLLAQQLAILSQEQRQQHEQELLEQTHYFRSRKRRQQRDRKLASGLADHNTVRDKVVPRAGHCNQLLIAHQVESTDSAYDYLATVANRQQQQQQQQQAASMLAVHPTCSLQLTTTSGPNKPPPLTGNSKIARRQQLDALRNQDQQQQQHASGPPPPAYSLAYQLMSARKHATPVQHHHHHHNQLPGSLTISPGEPPTGEGVSLNRLTCQSPASVVLITKYKIEWSLNEHFEPVLNSMIIYNSNSYPIECQISDLINGQLYYVRVSSGNQKGFREPRCTTPACLAPSSWRQVASTTAGKRKFKYDEQVFRKFTRLILLNKHILDENQVNALQREQLNMLSNRATSVGGTGSAKPVNKSSLINMLLLDATLPSSRQQILGQVLAPEVMVGAHRRKDTIRSDFELPPAAQPSTAFNLTINGAASPRGSLYPIESSAGAATSATGSGGKLSAGSIGGVSTMISGEDQAPVEQATSLKVRKNFKNFFQSSGAKFHKLNNQNKRGLYLVTVLYHQQQQSQAHATSGQTKSAKLGPGNSVASGEQNCKIVVTNDDRLPVIEVMNELVAPSSVMGDFYWLLKINGTKWIDIKRLRQQLQKSHSSSTLHLRIKLLQAIEQMQLALNLEDIGRLFYKPIQAHDGSIIICTCRQVTGNLKLVSNLSIKWTQQHKLIPRHLRKISETISFQANQQRDFQQQTQSQLTSGQSIQHNHQSTPIATKRHSSGAHKTGGSAGFDQQVMQHQQTAALAMGANGSAGQESSFVAGDATGSGHMVQLMGANSPPDNDNQQLCKWCQQTRRCAMASGSSSSSLASNESQSTWSSSQFSLNSQYQATSGGVASQQAQQQFTCTCSRSASSATIGLVTQPTGSNQLTTGNTNCAGQYAASAPTSQRNSTSARSSTSGQSYQIHAPHHHQSLSSAPGGGISGGSSSFSLSSGGGALNLTEARLSAHAMTQQRQTQSQQLSGAMQPQKSSTYLMLASLSPYDLLLFHLSELIEFNQNSTVPLKRGLYLGFVQLQTTVESMRLLVPRKRPNMIPCTRIRDNAHVSREEWHLLKQFGSLFGASCAPTSGGACEPTGNAEQVAPNRSSGRSSDPSIWTSGSGVGQPQVATGESREQTGSEPEESHFLSTSGFERGRAKSVSPADETARESAARARVHAAEVVRDATGSGLKPTTEQQQQKHAHSDTDLQAGATGSRSRPNSAGTNSSESNLYDHRVEDDEHFRCTAAQPSEQSPEMTFIRLVGDAAKRLLYELKSQLPKVYDCEVGVWKSAMASLNEQANNRVYHLELIELSNQVTFVLLIPAPENVCPVTSHDKSNMLTNTDSDYMLLPLQIFETIHLHTYEPDLLGKYSRLSTILETDLIVAQHDHRQAFSSSELKTTKSRVTQLQDMVGVADEFWRQLRWLVDVVSFARDKSQAPADSSTGCLRVGAIWRHFDSTMNLSGALSEATSSGLPGAQQESTGSGSPRLEVSASHNENGSGNGNDGPQVGVTSGRPKPPCLPQIQLPSGESLMNDSELDTQAKRARRKCSNKQVSRHLSAGTARPRVERRADEQSPDGALIGDNNQRRHSQGERKADTRKRTSDGECHYQTTATHLDDETTTTTTFARVGDQRSSRDAGSHRQYEPDESILKLHFGPDSIDNDCEPSSSSGRDCVEDADDEAIYAYHISLRDATRAAASVKRKSSQHSVNVFLVEGEEKQTFAKWPVSSSSSLSTFEPVVRSNDQGDTDGTTTMIEFELAGKSEPLQLLTSTSSVTAFRNNNKSEKAHEKNNTREQHERRARLKSTNPFLTESFDL